MVSEVFPILSLTILLPLLGAIATGVSHNVNLAKKIALSIAGLELIATLVVVWLFDAAKGNNFQLVEQYAWIPSLNIIGIDGISILFLPMSALLTLVAIIASWNSVQNLTRFHFALLLALEGGTMGVFVAMDLMLFFLFWELILPPIFFLIGLWGAGPQRRGAAMKYMLYMLFSGALLLFAFVMLAVNHATQMGGSIPQSLSFSFPVLLNTTIPDNIQLIVFYY